MNGRYATMEDPSDRMAEVFIACIDAYYQTHAKGSDVPSRTYISRYIKEFMDRERVEVEIETYHTLLKGLAADYERSLLERQAELIRNCNKRIGIRRDS